MVAAMTLIAGMQIRVPKKLLEKLQKSAQTILQGIIAQTEKHNELFLLLKQSGIKSITVGKKKKHF